MLRCLFLITFSILVLFTFNNSTYKKKDLPKVCISFDDGNTSDIPGYTSEEWNALLLEHLKKNKIESVLFVMGKALNNEKGLKVLQSWSSQGHLIANHTYSHKSYNSNEISFENYRDDFLKNDSLIRRYNGYTKLFRFPYLKEGNSLEKRDSFRKFLSEQNYRNGYVTIDASDWFINARLIKRLKENPNANIDEYRKFYLEHIWERAVYYNELSLKITGRQINHSLLLHHNLASALFMDDLIKMFKKKGWKVVGANEAYMDEIYKKSPDIIPAGESLIWALAKESGLYENLLRYPAEDSKYEEPKMDKLGL